MEGLDEIIERLKVQCPRALLNPQTDDVDVQATAAKELAKLAKADRLSCAVSGALTVVSVCYQNAPSGSALESNAQEALNHFLARDQTTPYFVSNLMKYIADAKTDPVSARHAAGALYVLNQKVYKPEKGTQDAIILGMPRFVEFIASPDQELAVNLCNLIDAFGVLPGEMNVQMCLSGALPLLAAVYQQSEKDSELEAASLAALNKIVMYKGDDRDRTRLVTEVVAKFDGGPYHDRALGALSVLNQKIYGATDMTRAAVIPFLDRIVQSLSRRDKPDVPMHAALTLSGFADGSPGHHFKVIRTASMVDMAESSSAPAGVRETCTAALSKLIYDCDQERKDQIFRSIADIWADNATDETLLSCSKWIHVLATKQRARWDIVGRCFPKFLSKIRSAGKSGRVAGTLMLTSLVDLDSFCRQQAVLLGCVPPIVAMMEKDDIEEQETSALCIVALSRDKIGAEVVSELMPAILRQYRSASSSSLDSSIVSMLCHITSQFDSDGHQRLVDAGIVDTLMPIYQSQKAERGSAMAAVALAQLIGGVENGPLTGDKVFLQVIVEILRSTQAGQDYQKIHFEPWVATKAFLYICMAQGNRTYLMGRKAFSLLAPLLRNGDLVTQQNAARAVWNAAFTCDIGKDIPSILPLLKEVEAKAIDVDVRSACAGAIFQIAQYGKSFPDKGRSFPRNKPPPETLKALAEDGSQAPGAVEGAQGDQPAFDGHIMVSYHRANEKMALWIADRLQLSGHRVWIAVNADSASAMESRIRAVDDSVAMVCCMSKSYRSSESNRSEAEYALLLGRQVVAVVVDRGFKADGWLTRLRSGEPLEINGPDENSWERNIGLLIEELGEAGKLALGQSKAGDEGTVQELLRAQRRAQEAEEKLKHLERNSVSLDGIPQYIPLGMNERNVPHYTATPQYEIMNSGAKGARSPSPRNPMTRWSFADDDPNAVTDRARDIGLSQPAIERLPSGRASEQTPDARRSQQHSADETKPLPNRDGDKRRGSRGNDTGPPVTDRKPSRRPSTEETRATDRRPSDRPSGDQQRPIGEGREKMNTEAIEELQMAVMRIETQLEMLLRACCTIM